MEFRRNIIFSVVLHAMIIIAVFAVSVGVRDMREHLRPDYLTVSLFKEKTGTVPVASQSSTPLPFPPNPPMAEQAGSKKPETSRTEGSPPEADREKVYKKETNSPELVLNETTSFLTTVLNDKVEESTSLSPPFTKGGIGRLLEQNSDSQNTGKSQSGNEILESIKRRAGNDGTGNPYTLIRDAIEKAKIYPFLARKKRIEGTVITGFTINSKGYPQDVKIEKSSGSEILDSAAIKIVMKAAPFPVVDGKIAVPISFKLTGYSSSYISSR